MGGNLPIVDEDAAPTAAPELEHSLFLEAPADHPPQSADVAADLTAGLDDVAIGKQAAQLPWHLAVPHAREMQKQNTLAPVDLPCDLHQSHLRGEHKGGKGRTKGVVLKQSRCKRSHVPRDRLHTTKPRCH